MSSQNSPPTKVKVGLDRGLKPDVGKIGLLFTGVGSIIGSGWLFGAFEAAALVGPAAIISWILGAIMIIIVALNYAELGVMFPVAGGVVRFPHYAFGSFASYTSGWITWLAVVATVPIEVLAAVRKTEENEIGSIQKATRNGEASIWFADAPLSKTGFRPSQASPD